MVLIKMVKEQKPDYSSFEKYMYGALAGRMLTSEESARHAPSALEVLAGKKGLNLGEESLGFVKGTMASEEGRKIAIDTYSAKFAEERGKYKPIDMAAWYDSVLKDIKAEDKAKILGELGKYNEPIATIYEKINDALNTLDKKARKDKFTEAQISSAKQTLEKYQRLTLVLETLDNYKFEELRPEVIKESRKKDLESLASKL